MWWIKAAIQEYILRSWSLVKLGTTANHRRLFFRLREAKSKIFALDVAVFMCTRIKVKLHFFARAPRCVMAEHFRCDFDTTLEGNIFVASRAAREDQNDSTVLHNVDRSLDRTWRGVRAVNRNGTDVLQDPIVIATD